MEYEKVQLRKADSVMKVIIGSRGKEAAAIEVLIQAYNIRWETLIRSIMSSGYDS